MNTSQPNPIVPLSNPQLRSAPPKRRWLPTLLLPQLLLAAFLHLAPLASMLLPAPSALPGAPAAIVLRWAAALAALAGTFHTVSAASAAIVGLTKYVNNTPSGSPTNNAVALEGTTFRYRITVSNAGSDHKKDYFNCEPLPPGLTINTNLGGTGFITNAPNASLVPGVYAVKLIAGNTSYPTPVTYNATITIVGNAPPAPPHLSTPRRVNGSMVVEVTGLATPRCALWASSDLLAWDPVATNSVVNGAATFTDPAPSQPKRYYSASALP